VVGKGELLSRPRPRMEKVRLAQGAQEEEVLRIALLSVGIPRHPYAEAVRRYAEENRPGLVPAHAAGVDFYPGRGVRALLGGKEVWVGTPGWLRGKGVEGEPGLATSSLWVAKGSRLLGALDFDDPIRDSAPPAVQAFREMGIEVVLASGDSEAKVRRAAESLGLGTFHSGIRPSDRLALVAGFQARGKKVAAAGRGLLEAPILAQADLGVALDPGVPADARLEEADLGAFADVLRRASRVRFACRLNLLLLALPHAVAAAWAALGRPSEAAAVGALLLGLAMACSASLGLRSGEGWGPWKLGR